MVEKIDVPTKIHAFEAKRDETTRFNLGSDSMT
jgi:hypothetical protein